MQAPRRAPNWNDAALEVTHVLGVPPAHHPTLVVYFWYNQFQKLSSQNISASAVEVYSYLVGRRL